MDAGQRNTDQTLKNVPRIQKTLAEEHQLTTDYLSEINDADLSAGIKIARWDGINIVMTRWHMLAHMLLHSIQHRSEAAVNIIRPWSFARRHRFSFLCDF